jgi:hypothetical protein
MNRPILLLIGNNGKATADLVTPQQDQRSGRAQYRPKRRAYRFGTQNLSHLDNYMTRSVVIGLVTNPAFCESALLQGRTRWTPVLIDCHSYVAAAVQQYMHQLVTLSLNICRLVAVMLSPIVQVKVRPIWCGTTSSGESCTRNRLDVEQYC